MNKIKSLILLLNLIIVGLFIWEAPFLYRVNKVGIDYINEIIEAHNIIKTENIYQKLTSDDLFAAALNGMATEVDIFSGYNIQKDAANEEKTYGVGVALSSANIPQISLLEVAKGQADIEATGIQNGDTLLAINGEDVSKMNHNDIRNRIQGPLGTKVTLKVKHIKTNQTKDITMQRQEIYPVDIEYYNINKDIAMLYSTDFESGSDSKWLEYIQKAKLSGVPKCLVLDLRDNLGGNLFAALNITEMFISHNPGEDKLIITEMRLDKNKEGSKEKIGRKIFDEDMLDILPDTDIVILVSKETSSAAEIFSSTLQFYKRGLVVGQKTYGKDLIQSHFLTSRGGDLKITTGYYLNSNNQRIFSKGVIPDIVIPNVNHISDEALQGFCDQAHRRSGIASSTKQVL